MKFNVKKSLILLGSALVVVGLIVGNYFAVKYKQVISVYFGHDTTKIVNNSSKKTDYYKSSFKSDVSRKKYAEKLSTDIVAEGAILLKNDGNILPLKKGSKISMLGQSSADLVYGGGGSGAVDTKNAITLHDSLTKAGFKVNPTLWNFYTEGAGKEYRRTIPDAYGKGEFEVNEVPSSKYTSDVTESFKKYNDVALVVIGRSGGESSDLPTKKLNSGSHYLELDQNEKDLLKLATDNFDKVVVLVNASNTLELGFLNEYNIDACINVGALGEKGALALGKILSGELNPSGSTIDTYAYDTFSSPAMQNLGNYSISNSKIMFGNKYMAYAENIYVGYRYYETRYEDTVIGRENVGNYDYQKQVQFPFGYGLSYTEFTWDNYKMTEDKTTLKFSVDVTNNGKVRGKDTIQIYMQSPYTDYDKKNSIEKSSVELVGFEKTKELKPKETQKITITVDKEKMKTYDAYNQKAYILDAGDYYFAAGENAHQALNNILSAKEYTTKDGMDAEGNRKLVEKITINKQDTNQYSKSLVTDEKITNQFDNADLKQLDNTFKYLSRSDWQGSWPSTYKDGNWQAPESFIKDLAVKHEEKVGIEKPDTEKISKKYGKLDAAAFIGVDYNDELWEVLLDQLSVEDMTKLVRMGGYATVAIPSINLPATLDRDGPAGISNQLVGGASSKNGTAFPVQVTLAATWNKKLAKEMGEVIGDEALSMGINGWYAPGVNLHRTPFGGRNFEYYSEDPFLSGELSAVEIKGVQSKGTFVYMKHFALNDSETNRMGGVILANEQTIRQLYLTPFEISVRKGNAHGAMSAMNRIGAFWSGAHKGLMTETLRNEWGFKGMVVTDQASFKVFAYEDVIQGQSAGTNLWLNTDGDLWKFSDESLNPTVLNNLRKSTKDIIFTIVNSNAMNGIAKGDKIVNITPLWMYWLYILDGLVIVILGSTIFFVLKKTKKY